MPTLYCVTPDVADTRTNPRFSVREGGDLRHVPDGPSADLVSSVCHDLKQHIAVGLLLSEPGPDHVDAGVLAHRLEVLHSQFEYAASLVSILSGDPTSDATCTNLAIAAARAVEAVQTTHRVAFEVHGVDHFVHCEPMLVRRATTNLLDNACRAATRDGAVTVRIVADGDERWVEVADDGPGFGAIAPGTGRGMSIVRDAVRAGAGRLLVSAGPEGGTVVRMTFPAPGTALA